MAVLEFHLERRAGERLDHAADEAQRVFFDDGRFEGGPTASLAAAASFTRWGNGISLIDDCERGRFFGTQLAASAPGQEFVMLIDAIVFGMVGVAAGFTWEYVIQRGR